MNPTGPAFDFESLSTKRCKAKSQTKDQGHRAYGTSNFANGMKSLYCAIHEPDYRLNPFPIGGDPSEHQPRPTGGNRDPPSIDAGRIRLVPGEWLHCR